MGAFRGGKDWWRIDWTGPNEQQPFAFDGDAGWRFIDCHPNGGKIESSYEMPYQGMEALGQTNEPKPFANSKLAYDAVFKMIGD
jgi:hypothetical protein